MDSEDLLEALTAAIKDGSISQNDVVNALAGIPGHGAGEALVTQARQAWQDDDLEIDDNALTSPAETGAWVSAWVWVEGGQPGE